MIAQGLTVCAGSAWAADPQNPPDDHAVTLSPVALPVVADGRVVNYVFVPGGRTQCF